MNNNLLTIIGNATVDNYFLEQLFKEPFRTVEKFGFQLTDAEKEYLRYLTQGEHATKNFESLANVRTCPVRPCAIALPYPEGFGPPHPEQQKIA
jgi:hypothetical protein